MVRIDVGLCGPCYDHENKNSGQIYGVLSYIAPEVLRGEDYYTPASGIYLFDIIMNTLATGKRPWYDKAHDINLAENICDGKRLEIPGDTPEFYAELIRICCDNEPDKRPTASHICKTLSRNNLLCDYDCYDNTFSSFENTSTSILYK
ncbi:kinase-like domain-containing protein [Rhizophagus diaphanus]|nr:kinase-like domain-containing protein [Rhizophagus diaphanus] [Rhizophagus sp. MUCL 43196]